MFNKVLPELTNLSPTLESTCLKLMEEAGELAELIGKFRQMSGETIYDERYFINNIAGELLDVAQTAVTMMYVLEKQYKIDMDTSYNNHIDKLRIRGYIK